MKKLLGFLLILFIWACGNGTSKNDQKSKDSGSSNEVKKIKANDGKGIGEIKHVELNDPLDATMIASGKAVYELKCAACHKLSKQKVVGPGWEGITKKRKPEWVMNMILNVEVMLDKDPVANALFRECLTRMPNQNLTEQEARDVLEFMYANDRK